MNKDEEKRLVDGLKLVYAKYPKWLDRASYNQSQKFKRIADEAKFLALKRNHDHLWVIEARGVLREHTNLRLDIIGP